jgi:hypothetical protein
MNQLIQEIVKELEDKFIQKDRYGVRFIYGDDTDGVIDLIITSLQKVIEAERKSTVEGINKMFPPIFIHEVSYGEGIILRGISGETNISRMSLDESKRIDSIAEFIKLKK